MLHDSVNKNVGDVLTVPVWYLRENIMKHSALDFIYFQLLHTYKTRLRFLFVF